MESAQWRSDTRKRSSPNQQALMRHNSSDNSDAAYCLSRMQTSVVVVLFSARVQMHTGIISGCMPWVYQFLRISARSLYTSFLERPFYAQSSSAPRLERYETLCYRTDNDVYYTPDPHQHPSRHRITPPSLPRGTARHRGVHTIPGSPATPRGFPARQCARG